MNEVIESIIRSAVQAQYIYSKIQFDNAKDNRDLLEAAKAADESLMLAIDYRLRPRVEELFVMYVTDTLKDEDECFVKVGSEIYKLSRYRGKQ